MSVDVKRVTTSLSVSDWRLVVDALDELAAHTPDWHEADKIAGLCFSIESLLREAGCDVSRV
jgi:hypothetical protein